MIKRASLKKRVTVVEIGNDWLKIIENSPAVIGRVVSKVSFTRLAQIKVSFTKLVQINEAVSTAVARTFKDLNLNKENVITYIPRHLVTVRILEFPSTDIKEINEMVSLQVGKQTPYSKEEIFSAHKILHSNRQGYTKVMLVIARRNLIAERISTLQSAGIEVEKVGVSTEGVYNWFSVAYLADIRFDAQQACILLDVDSNYSDFIVIRKEGMVFTRSLLIGANQLREELDKWQDKLIEEIRHSIELYQSEEKAVKIAKIFISGAGKKINGLNDLLSTKLEIPAEATVSTKNMRIKEDVDLLRDPNLDFISVCALFGMAIKHKEMGLDLTPPELRIQRRMEEKRKQLMLTGILFTSIVMVMSLLLLVNIYAKNAYLALLKEKISKIESDAVDVEKMRTRINTIEKRLDAKAASINVLIEIYRLTPREIYLTNINIEEKDKTAIRGRANAMSDVFKYVTTLEASDIFYNVNATYITTKRESNVEYAEFEIACFHGKE